MSDSHDSAALACGESIDDYWARATGYDLHDRCSQSLHFIQLARIAETARALNRKGCWRHGYSSDDGFLVIFIFFQCWCSRVELYKSFRNWQGSNLHLQTYHCANEPRRIPDTWIGATVNPSGNSHGFSTGKNSHHVQQEDLLRVINHVCPLYIDVGEGLVCVIIGLILKTQETSSQYKRYNQ